MSYRPMRLKLLFSSSSSSNKPALPIFLTSLIWLSPDFESEFTFLSPVSLQFSGPLPAALSSLRLASLSPFLKLFFNWCVINIQCYTSVRCTKYWFSNFIHYLLLTTVSIVNICYHKMLLQYYWPYSLCCSFHIRSSYKINKSWPLFFSSVSPPAEPPSPHLSLPGAALSALGVFAITLMIDHVPNCWYKLALKYVYNIIFLLKYL